MAEEFGHLPKPKVRIGQVWSHHQDCTHYLIVGKTDNEWLPWKARVVKENPDLANLRVVGQYAIGYETEVAIGLGLASSPAWYLVKEVYPCPQCEQSNYIPDNDYICEVCRGL